MTIRSSLAAASLALLLIAPGRLAAREHPEHPKEHPADKKQAGLSRTDLAAAIRSWVEKEAAANGGWLKVEDPVQHKTLELKLEKVHDDKLARVKPDEHFACADFVEKDGTKYDIDVFMQGKGKDDLREVEITVHRVNSKARYTWLEAGGIWKKKPLE